MVKTVTLFTVLCYYSCQKLLGVGREVKIEREGVKLTCRRYKRRVCQSGFCAVIQRCINKKVIFFLMVTPSFLRNYVVDRVF